MKRLLWLDTIKGLAIISVVFGHCEIGKECLAQLNLWVYSFHMPLFFMVSGYSYSLLYNKKSKKQWISVGDFLCIYFFYSILYVVLDNVQSMIFAGADKQLFWSDVLLIWKRPIAHFWYLWILIGFYICQNFIHKTKFILYGSVCFSFILRILSILVVECNNLFIRYWLFFQIGIVLYFFNIEKLFEKKLVKLLLGFLSVIAIPLSYVILNCGIENGFIKILYTIILCLAVWIVAIVLFSKEKLISFVGKKSLWIYIFHNYFVSIGTVISEKMLNWTPYFATIIITIVGVFGPVILSLIMERMHLDEMLIKPVTMLVKKVMKYNVI